jgi:hypothetical protein
MLKDQKEYQHTSDLDWVWAPSYFYIYLYNQTHRPRLEKLFYLVLSRSSKNGFKKKHFRIQMAVSILKPPNNGFRSETAFRN